MSAATQTSGRPRHVPQRTCVICRDKTAKRDLIRIVRMAEGSVDVDPSGRVAGRGAYLCRRAACWEQAATGNQVSGALRTTLNDADRDRLQAFAVQLTVNEEATSHDH